MIRKLLLILIMALVSAVPAWAQEPPPWAVYLYNGSTRELLAVTLDGAQQPISLGLTPDLYPLQSNFPFSADGRYTAYCIVTYADDGAPQSTVVVRDLMAQADAMRVNIGVAIGCTLGGFSDDSTQLMIGIVRTYPGDPNFDSSQPLWAVQRLDIATGTLQTVVDAFSPALDLSSDESQFALLPIFQRYADGELIFSLQPFGTEGNPNAPAYRWSAADGSLTRVANWGGFGLDYLASTGELAWLANDPARLSGTPLGPMPIYNVVRVTGSSGVESVVYESGTWLPYDLVFANQGRQLVISMIESGDPNNPMPLLRTRLVTLDRSGAVGEVGLYGSFVQVSPAPDGFVLLWAEDTGGTRPPELVLEYHSSAGVRELWRTTSDNMGVSWNIAATSPLSSADGLTPFPALP